MSLFDTRTVIFSYVISNAICVVFMTLLWTRNRKRFAGLGLWLVNCVLQFAGIALIILRGIVPEAVSAVLGNALLIGGLILLYVGLERFAGKRGPQIQNAFLLAAFIGVHTCLFNHPLMEQLCLTQLAPSARWLNISLGVLLICLQAVWLLLYRVDVDMHPITRSIGMILAALCVVSIAGILVGVFTPPGNDLFHAGTSIALVVLAYQMLGMILTFGLSMMVSHRLLVDLERDIAARQQIEHALRESQRFTQQVIDAIPNPLFYKDTHGFYLGCNTAFESHLGLPKEAIIGKSVYDVAPQELAYAVHESEQALLRQPGIQVYESPVQYADGIRHDVIFNKATFLNAGGALGGLVGIMLDITERKLADRIIALRLELWEFAAEHTHEELMQKALDKIGEITSSPIGFYHFVEADQKTLSLQAWSTRTEREFCKAEGKGRHYSIDEAGVWVDCVYQRKPVIHNDYAALPHRKGMPPGHAEVKRELVVPTLRAGNIVSILGVGNKPTPYDEKDVELVAYVADIIWTIIEHKRAQDTLSRYTEQLAAQNAELDAFAHTVAHDLKNPVSIIVGYANLLSSDHETMPPQDLTEALRRIVQTGQRLDRIIEELMLLAGIRKQEVVLTALDMSAIVQEAIERVHILIQERQGQITRLDEAAWPVALGYAPWVEEVWANYITNAIKYGGPTPHVTVGADLLATPPAPPMVRFWVRDNGPGLSAEGQQALFAPFTRLDQARIKGHGLGLSVVRRIVERLGGQAGVESQPGQGSTFFFTLPLAG